jgi:hypothetical protein
MDVTLLGPQRRVAGARTAVAELIPEGPVATVNAGWRERESDTGELDAVLGGRMLNLELYRRWLQLLEADPAYADAERRLTSPPGGPAEGVPAPAAPRDRRGAGGQPAGGQRRGPRGGAGRRGRWRPGPGCWHVARSGELRRAFYSEVGLGERSSVADHRHDIARLVADSAGMVFAGGHVGVLLHLLHVFGLAALLRPPVIAWSAGAMALSPRVVLFGDHAPYGHPDPEVYAEGLGAYRQAIPFPHARRRLRLSDSEHIGLLAARLAPCPALRLDDGVRLDLVDGQPLPEQAAQLGAGS